MDHMAHSRVSLHEQVRMSCRRTVRRLLFTCATCMVLGLLIILFAPQG